VEENGEKVLKLSNLRPKHQGLEPGLRGKWQ
jgi:hypothetical protein